MRNNNYWFFLVGQSVSSAGRGTNSLNAGLSRSVWDGWTVWSMAVVAYTVYGCMMHVDCLSLEYSVVQLQSKVVRRRMSVELRDLEGLGPCK